MTKHKLDCDAVRTPKLYDKSLYTCTCGADKPTPPADNFGNCDACAKGKSLCGPPDHCQFVPNGTPANEVERCNCNLRTRLVGDGCEKCNPEYAAQFTTDADEVERAAVFFCAIYGTGGGADTPLPQAIRHGRTLLRALREYDNARAALKEVRE